jgi:hypothetical protein
LASNKWRGVAAHLLEEALQSGNFVVIYSLIFYLKVVSAALRACLRVAAIDFNRCFITDDRFFVLLIRLYFNLNSSTETHGPTHVYAF